jgi:hypothetical protein
VGLCIPFNNSAFSFLHNRRKTIVLIYSRNARWRDLTTLAINLIDESLLLDFPHDGIVDQVVYRHFACGRLLQSVVELDLHPFP